MSEVGTYPNAATLTGTERILADQGGTPNVPSATGTTVNLTPAQLAAYVGSAIGALGIQTISNNTTFTQAVAGAPLIANYQFGTAAGGPGITAITNLTQLGQHFNPFEDYTNLTSINSELERYQPFNSANHVFNPTNLTLQAVNPNGDFNCPAISQIAGAVNLNNTPTSIANLGLANTTGIQVGQFAAIQGGGGVGGGYLVTAVVSNTSVTLQALNGAPTSPVSGGSIGLIFWLPVVSATLSGPTLVGGNTMTFTALPPTVTNGMQIGWYNFPVNGVTLNRDQDYRITNIAGNTITFSPVLGPVGNMGTGERVWFLPVVTSGQIWSQMQVDITNPQNFFAIEANLTVLGPTGAVQTVTGNDGQITLAQFNAFPTTTPLGAFPAFWIYNAQSSITGLTTGNAEIDIMEIPVGCTQGITYANTGNDGGGATATTFAKSVPGSWTYQSAFGIFVKTDGTNFVGNHLWQLVYSNGFTYRFFDGILFKINQFYWDSQEPLQFAVDNAVGGLEVNSAQNTVFPNQTAGFSNISVAVNGIKVWYQANGPSIFPPPTP